MWIVLLFLWNSLTGINTGKMALKFNLDHEPIPLELLVNSTVKLNSNELGALKRQSVVYKHGKRTYSRDCLLSQRDQIRTGEIQEQLGVTTCINVHQTICAGEEREVGSD